MFASQQLVIRWIEFFVAGALLLVAAKIVIGRLRQPSDRINFILMRFVTTSVVPLLMLFIPVLHWQPSLVASEHPIANEWYAALPGRDAAPETSPVIPKIHPGHAESPRFVAYLPESNRNGPQEQETVLRTPLPTIPPAETTPLSVSRRVQEPTANHNQKELYHRRRRS